jgi:GMP synthase (glutamine-hydrolysing)
LATVTVLQHVPHETLGNLEEAFDAAGVACRHVPLFAQPVHELPWHWEELAGLVVLGGPMNVDQVSEFPFLQREVDWIRQVVARGVPVLGICLGSQLLAKAFGARVTPNRVKEIGWYEVELFAPADDPLFGGLHGRHTVFQWHGDTFELPAGAAQLARSELCDQQAFRYGTNAYGLQFHIEVTAAMVDQWLLEPQNQQELCSLNYIDPATIRDRLPMAICELEVWGQQVLARFAELCQQRGNQAPLL